MLNAQEDKKITLIFFIFSNNPSIQLFEPYNPRGDRFTLIKKFYESHDPPEYSIIICNIVAPPMTTDL